MFFYLEASQPSGATYRLGLGCFAPPKPPLDGGNADTVVLREGHPGDGVSFSATFRSRLCKNCERYGSQA
jgi:hypothetical protein